MKEMNENEMVNVGFLQKMAGVDEPMHFSMAVPRRILNRMSEIIKRDPPGTWKERDFDLMEQANRELEEVKKDETSPQESGQE